MNKKLDQARKSLAEQLDRDIQGLALGGFISGNTAQNATRDTRHPNLRLEDLQTLVRDMPPPPPTINVTEHATSLPKDPTSPYMREMVERLGQTRRPAVFKMTIKGRDTFHVHPDLVSKLNEKLRGDT